MRAFAACRSLASSPCDGPQSKALRFRRGLRYSSHGDDLGRADLPPRVALAGERIASTLELAGLFLCWMMCVAPVRRVNGRSETLRKPDRSALRGMPAAVSRLLP